MASTNVPGLSSWITGSGKKLDEIMTNFAISNYSQSFCYHGEIVSLPYLIATCQHNPDTLQQTTRNLLMKYLTRYYDEVKDLTVVVRYISKETERVDLSVGGYVVEKGVSYDMEGLLRAERGKFTEWTNEVNNGQPNE